MGRIAAAGLLLGSFLAAGCSEEDDPVFICPAILLFSVTVTVEDSLSGDPVGESLVWVKDGSFVDTLSMDGNRAFTAYERAGTYMVVAEKVGYRPWVEYEVEVTEGPCGPGPVDLTARLVRNPLWRPR